MASSESTTCPKCGKYAEFNSDDGITYCQKEITEVLYPGATSFVKRGGGCGKMTTSSEQGHSYSPPNYRGGK